MIQGNGLKNFFGLASNSELQENSGNKLDSYIFLKKQILITNIFLCSYLFLYIFTKSCSTLNDSFKNINFVIYLFRFYCILFLFIEYFIHLFKKYCINIKLETIKN